MATRQARVIRGLVASCVAVFVAAFAHVIGGAAVPDAGSLSVAFAFSVLASVALTGRRLSTIRLAATVVLSQGLFHVVFLLSGGTAVTAAAGPGMQMGAAPMVVTAGPGMVEDGWMWLAHGGAAVVTIAALVWGERAFWKLFSLVRRVLRREPVALRPALAPLVPNGFTRSARAARLRGSLKRRGPPVGAASA